VAFHIEAAIAIEEPQRALARNHGAEPEIPVFALLDYFILVSASPVLNVHGSPPSPRILIVQSLHQDVRAGFVTPNPQPPRIAADFAIVDHFAANVGFDKDLHGLATVGTDHGCCFR